MRESIDDIRRRIEVIDYEILRLMANRTAAAVEMGEKKAGESLPLRNPAVEEKVIARYVNRAREFGMSPEAAAHIAALLIHESIEKQGKIPRPSRQKKILIVGGSGKMGPWFCRYLASRGHKIKVCDPMDSPQFPLERDFERGVKEAEVIVVATPIAHVQETLEKIIELKPSALLFDISSLKTPIAPLLKKAAKKDLRVCSLHPMFGPDTDSIVDRNVVICDCGNDQATEDAAMLVEGARTIKMKIDEHDPLIAYILGLSHAVNIVFFTALMKSGVDFATLSKAASTTFKKQSETSRDVAFDNAQLYYEIQHLNPYNQDSLLHLKEAVEDLRKAAASDDNEAFLKLMEEGRKYFGGK